MPAGPYSYELIDSQYDPSTNTLRSVSLSQLNDAGQVLGTLLGGGSGVPSQPFLYADGSFTLLAVPGALTTSATQLNNAGEVIGRYTDAAGAHSFLYQDGAYSEITVPGADFTTALQISGGGQILADYFDSAGLHPVIDDNGSFTTLAVPGAASTSVRANALSSSNSLPAINDADQVIGSYTDDAGSHAFLYDGSGNYTTLAVPDGFNTTATEINSAGQVLGTYTLAPGSSNPGNTRPFLYSDGTYTTIAPPGATSVTNAQLNDVGQVAGTYNDAAGTHAFLDTNGTYAVINPSSTSATSTSTFLTQLTNAGDVLASGSSSGPFVYSGGTSTDASVPGAPSTNLSRINDAGQLIGSFYDGVTTHYFLATPTGTGGAQAADTTGAVTPAADGGAGADVLSMVDGTAASMPDFGTTNPNVVLA